MRLSGTKQQVVVWVCLRWHALVVIAAKATGSVEDGKRAIGIVPDFDPDLDEMAPEGAFGDLQLEPVERHAIVVAHLAVFLDAENLAQIDAWNGHEGGARLGSLNRETGVVGGDIDVLQKPVGGLHGGDAGQRQFLDRARSWSVWNMRSERPRASGE